MRRNLPLRGTILLAVLTFLALPAFSQVKDSVAFVQVNPQECCYQIFLTNRHTPAGNINKLTVEISTADVVFIAGINTGPWPIEFESETRFEWGVPDQGLPHGEALDPFDICFDYRGPGIRPVKVVWKTYDQGKLASVDSIVIDCQPVSPHFDSLRVFSTTVPDQPDESCCYELRLLNFHEPPGNLNDLHVSILTPGAVFAGTADGPWDVKSQTNVEVVFATSGTPLHGGDSLDGFTVCVKTPDGLQGQVAFSWWSSIDGSIVCPGNFTAICVPVDVPRCDSLFANKQRECEYDFGFKNLHKPRGPITGYRMSVITPGANFTALTAPPGWQIASQTSLNARLNAISPVNYGGVVRGIRASFKPSSTGIFRVAVSTMNQENFVCRDTLTLTCDPPPPTFCDSLLLARLEGDCVWDIGFVNRHLPASPINDFHITLQTAGAMIDSAQAPAGWIVSAKTSTSVSFQNTGGTIPPNGSQTGFLLSVIPGPESHTVIFDWCSSHNGNTICCEVGSISCEPPEQRCDSLVIHAAAEYCRYDFGFVNMQQPPSDVDDFHVRLRTPDALILNAEAPQGWSVDSVSSTGAHFSKNNGSIATGESATGFMFDFVPSAGSRQIQVDWRTSLNGSELCGDTASVFCEVVMVQCDSVDVTTNVEQPCCFDFSLRNSHLPFTALNDFHVLVLTPNVILYPSTVESPAAWVPATTSTSVSWLRSDGDLQPGDLLDGFAVCFDNDAIGNQDFRILWQSTFEGQVICEDTLVVKCDRTLEVERLDAPRPAEFLLEQNYPNPFNPVTTIEFAVPYETDVDLALYDMSGRLLRDLGSGSYTAGRYRISLDASVFPSGTYIYRLRAGGADLSRRMILLK